MSIFKRGTVTPVVPALPEPQPEPEPDQDENLGEYGKLFQTMVIKPDWIERAEYAAKLIVSSKTRYQTVEKVTRTPWFLIGLIHLMESNCNFKTHLHNGDPLTARTRQVPRGRPIKGSPPFSWEESAVDSLQYDRILPPLNTIDEILYAAERYNGLGMKRRGLHTPYLWSGTNHYKKGKYVADGKFDPDAISKQVGICPVLKILIDKWGVQV